MTRARPVGLATLALLVMGWGCAPRPSERPAPPGAEADTPTPDTPPATAIDTPPTGTPSAVAVDTPPSMRPVRPGAPVATAPGERARPVPLPGPKTGAPRVSVAQVLETDRLVGHAVSVAGTCLRQGTSRAEGPPPVTRSDWELGAEGRAVWVSGPRPAGCTATEERSPVVMDARVEADTVRRMDGTVRVRRFLVVVAPG